MRDISELAGQKAFLKSLAENNFRLPEDVDHFAFLKALLSNLGSTDDELRDVLTYPVMAQVILDEQGRYP